MIKNKPPKLILGSVIILLIFSFVAWWFIANNSTSPVTNGTSGSQNQQEEAGQDKQDPESEQNTFDKTQYSLSDPSSIWVVVNKQRSIPADYAPELIVPDVQLRLSSSEQQMQISAAIDQAIEEMFAAASADGVQLVFGSGYRSGALQRQFYDSYVARDGRAAADTYSARPGHSEHQTGLAFDVTTPSQVCHLEVCFEDTPQGQWVAKNAHKHGFIIRYSEGKQNITGYQYEPWHLRFVGTKLASRINETNQTLEEFFDLGPAASY